MLTSYSRLVVSHFSAFATVTTSPITTTSVTITVFASQAQAQAQAQALVSRVIGQGQVSTWRERDMYGCLFVQSVPTPPPPVSILLERIPDWAIKHSCILTHVATGTTRDRNTIAQGTSRVGLLTRPDGCIAESHCSTRSLTYSLARSRVHNIFF